MSVWDILEIEETNDAQAIKKAYRVKLRQHHPEDDPEGFQRVREAYEKALVSLNQARENVQETVPETVLELSIEDAADTQAVQEVGVSERQPDPHQPFEEALHRLLSDPERRFQPEQWLSWIEQIQMLSISQQQHISDAAVDIVLANRWLPGEVIEWLWQGLSWQLLLTGTQQQSEVGEFLNSWRKQEMSVDLSHLSVLSGAEQRAALSFLRPFHIALGYGDTEALRQVVHQPMPALVLPSVQYQVSLLQAFLATNTYPETITGQMIERLIASPAESLAIEQWEVIGEISVRLGHAEAVDQVTDRLLTLNAFAEVAEIQYQRTLGNQNMLALCYAFLRQQWQPLPPVYWRAERRLFPAPESDVDRRLFDWLFGQLTEYNHPAFNHRLDFAGLDGLPALMVKAFWAGRSGSWAWIESLRKQLSTAETDADSTRLVTLTLHWIEQKLALQTGCLSLRQKLSSYETDAFFDVEPLTGDEVNSQTKAEWLECVIRHPVIPDSWFDRLMDEEILVREELWEVSSYPMYADSLSFFRCANPDFRLSSCWQDRPFEGMFEWTLFCFTHMSPVGLARQAIIDALPVLPESQRDGPFAKLLPFAAQPQTYLPDALRALDEHPEQFVFRSIVDAQITLLTRTCDQPQLTELAKAGEVAACCALSRLLEREHFDEAIVYWNLTAAALDRHPHFEDVVAWQQQSLLRLRAETGLEQESYLVTEPGFMHALLTKDKAWFIPPAEMADYSPVDEAKNFHYPMYHLLTQLHLGLGEKGYDLSSLKMFSHRRELQTDLQRETTDVAIAHLEAMYQRRLEQDIQVKGKKAVAFSKINLLCLLVVFCTAWLFSFPSTFGELGKQDIFHLSHSGRSFAKLFFTPLFVYLLWQISSAMIEKRNKYKFVLYSGAVLWVAQSSQSLFCAIVTIVTLFSTTYGLTDLLANGGWEKRVVKSRIVNLRKVLGLKEKKR
ncbi:J domain-containing protein [Photobacterium sp. R1]